MMRLLVVAAASTVVCSALQQQQDQQQPVPAGSLPGELMAPEQLAELASSVPVHMRDRTKPAHTGTHFDCKVREYAYEYAQTLQQWRGAAKMQ
jgi:hypothetical protein